MIAVQSNVPHDKEQTLPLTNKDGTRGQVLIAHAVLTLLGESPPRIDRLDSRSANHLTSCAAPEFPMVPFRHQFRILLSTKTAAFLPPPPNSTTRIPCTSHLTFIASTSLPTHIHHFPFHLSPVSEPSPSTPSRRISGTFFPQPIAPSSLCFDDGSTCSQCRSREMRGDDGAEEEDAVEEGVGIGDLCWGIGLRISNSILLEYR